MARKIIHQLIDDIDGTVLEPGEGESIVFALDGRSYEIDLTAKNAAELRDFLAPYISAGRRAGSAAPAGKRSAKEQIDYAPIRKWAKENGYTLSDRGRVPAKIIEDYRAAN